MQITDGNKSYMCERICPNCGDSCEKDYETFFVHDQELCFCCNSNIEIFQLRSVCCNSDIELCYEVENVNVFVDFLDE